MSHARLQRAFRSVPVESMLKTALRNGVAGASGALMLDLMGCPGQIYTEALMIGAAGGCAVGIGGARKEQYMQDTNYFRWGVYYGLSHFGLHRDTPGNPNISLEVLADISENALTALIGFALVTGVDLLTGKRNRMTLGNVMLATAVGTLPFSLAYRFIEGVMQHAQIVKDNIIHAFSNIGKR